MSQVSSSYRGANGGSTYLQGLVILGHFTLTIYACHSLFINPSDSRWATETLQCLRDLYPPRCPFCCCLRVPLPLCWLLWQPRARSVGIWGRRSINMKFKLSPYDFILKNCQKWSGRNLPLFFILLCIISLLRWNCYS